MRVEDTSRSIEEKVAGSEDEGQDGARLDGSCMMII